MDGKRNKIALALVALALGLSAGLAMATSFGQVKAYQLGKAVRPQPVGGIVTEPQPSNLLLTEPKVYDCDVGHCVIGFDADRDCNNPLNKCEAGATIMHLRVTYSAELDVVGFELIDELTPGTGKEGCDVWMARDTFKQIVADLNLP